MSSVPGNKVMLLSCVGAIEGFGYKLIDNDEQIVAPQPSTAVFSSALSKNSVGQGEAASETPPVEWSTSHIEPFLSKPAPVALDCNCHPEDYPPVPCQHKRSYSECMRAALASAQAEIAALKRPGNTNPDWAAEIDALYEKATKGPYFVSIDEAHDTIAHPDSGLAMIDTGRQGDWPVLRLGEWPTTEFIASLVNAWPKIRQSLLRPGYVSVPRDRLVDIYNATISGEFYEDYDKATQMCGWLRVWLAASGEGKP